MKRTVTQAEVSHAPIIIGVDPAYSGDDDAVIYIAKGYTVNACGLVTKLLMIWLWLSALLTLRISTVLMLFILIMATVQGFILSARDGT